ncbi:hypothetical protein V7167_29120 [Bacillus toyonensis]|uniref:hypothetical protein n=1 Tax=Bacillus toyonensis TaxID=155322 RepID=UPI0015D4AEB3|nr:hypothetical protein [Bacillus toyonensis]
MKQETVVQVQSEIKAVENEICNLEYHLVMMDGERQKTKYSLEELKNRKEKLESYL